MEKMEQAGLVLCQQPKKQRKRRYLIMGETLKLSDLKTVRNGYDKMQVQTLLREILTQSVQEKEAAVEQAREEERAKMQEVMSQQQSAQDSFEKFDSWVHSLTDAWNQQSAYTKQQDAKLQQYYMREKELQESENKARREAEHIIAEAEVAAKSTRDQAQSTASQIISSAQAAAERTKQENEDACRRMQEEAHQLASSIVERAQQDAKRLADEAQEKYAQALQDAQKEREKIVAMSTSDIIQIREDHRETMNTLVKMLDALAERTRSLNNPTELNGIGER